jgi:hypothetical protein
MFSEDDLQCDISAPKLRAEEHASAMLRGHNPRDDRARYAGQTIIRSFTFM